MKLVPKLLLIGLVLAFVLGAFRFLSAPLSYLGNAYLSFLPVITGVVINPVILVVLMYNIGKTIDLGAGYAAAFDSLLIGALIGGFSGYTVGYLAEQYLVAFVPSQLAFLQQTDNIQIYVITVAGSLPLTALSLALVGFGALAFGFFSKKPAKTTEGQS
jgi:hypothetical protein